MGVITSTYRFDAELVGQRVDLLSHELDIVERQTELLREAEGPSDVGVAARLLVAMHLGHVEGGAPRDVVQHLMEVYNPCNSQLTDDDCLV